ncbi:MAG: hypothetical protein ACRC1M_06095 [Methanobacteriaceae archaeon]
MSGKKYVLVLLLFAVIGCVMLGSASAAKYSLVDEGSAIYKDSNNIKLDWKVYSSDKKLNIYNKIIKGNSTSSTKIISIEKINKNKLKITSNYTSKNIKNIKNSYIGSKLSPKYYYFKIYRNKMINNLVKTKFYEEGRENLVIFDHGYIEWKCYLYYGKKFFVFEKTVSPIHGTSNKSVLIERYGKDRLKISAKVVGVGDWVLTGDRDNFGNKFFQNKTITYVKTKLSPKYYYLNVYKPKMLENIPASEWIDFAYGLLNGYNTRIYWEVTSQHNSKFVWNKVSISRGYSLGKSDYDKTIIEISSKNKLKITHIVNKKTEIKYVKTNLLPIDYYSNIYVIEMNKIINASTIRHISIIR